MTTLGMARGLLPALVLPSVFPIACASARGPRDAGPTGRETATEREVVLERLARAYYPGRFGDIALIPAPGAILTWDQEAYRYMHGSPWDYDSHVPLLFFGSGVVRPGVYADPVSHQSVGATLGWLLGLPRRPTTTGRSLVEAFVVDPTSRPGAERAGSPPGGLRIVALLVLDAFRADYLDRWSDRLPNLTRLREAGAWFSNTRADYLPTATAVAHSSMVTGTDPAIHGITGNTLYDRAQGRASNSYDGASPRNLMAPTLTDRWSAATSGAAVIAAQGGTFYPAAALGGHGRCQFNGRPVRVSFYDSRAGRWATNTECYESVPALEEPDARIVWEGLGDWLGHEVSDPSEFRRTAWFARFEGEAVTATLGQEPFGEDATPDLFLANLKATDYVSHKYGPFSPEMEETVVEIDRQIGRIARTLEAKAGGDGYLLVVTADHGMPDEPTGGSVRRFYEEVVDLVNDRFGSGTGPVVEFFEGAENRMYLVADRLAALGLGPGEVARYLEELPFVAYAFTVDEVRRVRDTLP